MDFGGLSDDNMESDSVQWEGSQTACAALDSLLSEAAFKPQSGIFQGSRKFAGGDSGSSYLLHRSSSNTASASTSLSSRSFATASGSNRPGPSDLVSSWAATSNGLSAVPSWPPSSNDHRNRQSRPSASPIGVTLPVGDPDHFMNMLKGVSERIDGNIRSDASVSREAVKRRVSSKITTSGSGVRRKRVKRDVLTGMGTRSASESSARGNARDFSTLSCASTNIPPLIGSCDGISKSHSAQKNSVAFTVMDVDSPKPSNESMPPPPLPAPKARPPASTRPTTARLPPSRLSATSQIESMNRDASPLIPSRPPFTQAKPAPQSKDPSSISACSPTPVSTPRLHPLLDTERKQRRLKLERTISASLASFPTDPSPASNSPSPTISPSTPSVHQRPQTIRPQLNQQNSGPLPLSQGGVPGNAFRPPALGMRRTHTFPSTTHSSSTPAARPKASHPTKQKTFKPPLLSNSQPPSTPSTATSSRSSIPSSEPSSTSSKSSPPTSTDTPSSKSGDDDMEDLPPNSDADLSFGDAISLDVDMDALEEAMRKYD